jgi:glycyl-tRNA synthetase
VPCLDELHTQNVTHACHLQIEPGMGVPAFLAATQPLITPLDAYFDKVFVMCEEEAVRQGRLALLREVAGLSAGILDFSELPGF